METCGESRPDTIDETDLTGADAGDVLGVQPHLEISRKMFKKITRLAGIIVLSKFSVRYIRAYL